MITMDMMEAINRHRAAKAYRAEVGRLRRKAKRERLIAGIVVGITLAAFAGRTVFAAPVTVPENYRLTAAEVVAVNVPEREPVTITVFPNGNLLLDEGAEPTAEIALEDGNIHTVYADDLLVGDRLAVILDTKGTQKPQDDIVRDFCIIP